MLSPILPRRLWLSVSVSLVLFLLTDTGWLAYAQSDATLTAASAQSAEANPDEGLLKAIQNPVAE